jgi:hypothetical protein
MQGVALAGMTTSVTRSAKRLLLTQPEVDRLYCV